MDSPTLQPRYPLEDDPPKTLEIYLQPQQESVDPEPTFSPIQLENQSSDLPENSSTLTITPQNDSSPSLAPSSSSLAITPKYSDLESQTNPPPSTQVVYIKQGKNMIPVKGRINQNVGPFVIGLGILLGAGAGVPFGPITIAVGGLIGASIGRVFAQHNSKRAVEELYERYHQDYKRFTKPEKDDSETCSVCRFHFTNFHQRKFCNLCGRSFCGDDIPKRAYILFDQDEHFTYSKVCRSCFKANSQPKLIKTS